MVKLVCGEVWARMVCSLFGVHVLSLWTMVSCYVCATVTAVRAGKMCVEWNGHIGVAYEMK